MKRLAIIATHPIQYNAPWFRLLNERKQIELKVFYTWSQASTGGTFDHGFGKVIEWDIPLLDGYDYKFVDNTSANPGVHHFRGIVNPKLIQEVEEFHPAAVLIIGWSFQSHLKCIMYFHNKIPVFFRGDSTLLNTQFFLKKTIRTFFLKWIYHHVDIAFYVGLRNKEYFLAHGLKQDELVFTPHAIENERFNDTDKIYQEEAKKWRIKLNIKESDMVFLFAGKLEPKKNPELLIKAFAAIKKPTVHLVLVGNGILEKGIKMKYKGFENLHFMDFQNQSQMPIVYNLSNVFILPSKGPGETWGLAINEAMASSKPVIVSDKCGCAIDLVKEGLNGFIFKSNDVADLENKMKLLISNKSNLGIMGNHSLAIIKKWSFVNICFPIENALSNLEISKIRSK